MLDYDAFMLYTPQQLASEEFWPLFPGRRWDFLESIFLVSQEYLSQIFFKIYYRISLHLKPKTLYK